MKKLYVILIRLFFFVIVRKNEFYKLAILIMIFKKYSNEFLLIGYTVCCSIYYIYNNLASYFLTEYK